MIIYRKGDIFKTELESIVNPVNCRGIMGAGLAKHFKTIYPNNYDQYHYACRSGIIKLGEMFITRHSEAPKWIINFPTKDHWRNPSLLSSIWDGLLDLSKWIKRLQITSIGIPALGCGLGGLDWADVKPLIEGALNKHTGRVIMVFEP